MPGTPQFWIQIDIDIRRHAFVLDIQIAIEISESDARCSHLTAVDQGRITVDPNEPAPCSPADKRAYFVLSKKPWQEVATGTSILIDDHRFWTINSADRRCEIIAFTRRPVVH